MTAVDQSTLGREGVEYRTLAAPGVAGHALSTGRPGGRTSRDRGRARNPRARLLLANLIWLPPHPTTLILAREYATLPHEEDLDEVRATAGRAAALGIPTELLRISSRRPLAAFVDSLAEREPGLVVLGPDPRRSPRWWRALAARRIRARADCLVWYAPRELRSRGGCGSAVAGRRRQIRRAHGSRARWCRGRAPFQAGGVPGRRGSESGAGREVVEGPPRGRPRR